MFVFINHYLFSHPLTIQVLETEQVKYTIFFMVRIAPTVSVVYAEQKLV
jgi:hypothetical protein